MFDGSLSASEHITQEFSCKTFESSAAKVFRLARPTNQKGKIPPGTRLAHRSIWYSNPIVTHV